MGSIPQSGRFPWRRKWHPTPGFLPEESHGQRSLIGYSPYGHTDSGTSEVTQHTHKKHIYYTYTHINTQWNIITQL